MLKNFNHGHRLVLKCFSIIFEGKVNVRGWLMFSKDIESVFFILLATTFLAAMAAVAGILIALEWFAIQIKIV